MISDLIMQRRKLIEDMEQEFINSSNKPGTLRNKQLHKNRYFEFCNFNRMKPFPATEFKICKFATFLAGSMKTVNSIKSYCYTICEESELCGFRPVVRGLKYYKAITGIKNRLHHRVKRAQPMTVALLEKIEQLVDVQDQKELVVWTAMVTGFHMVLRKSNLVPIKRVHDEVHNIVRSDVRYAEGIMVILVRWSKTNQDGQYLNQVPLVAKPHSAICLLDCLLYMIETIPATGFHNLFSYHGDKGVVPITYHDLMVYMHRWLSLIGENEKEYSSHSLRRGGTSHAYKAQVPESDIQRMGHWRSQCFRNYIHDDMENRIAACVKFNQHC